MAFDHPVLGHQGIEQSIHGLGVPDPGELTALVARAQTADKVAAKVARERPHRKQVVSVHGPPASLRAQGTPGHQAVHVQMAGQRLAPGVQHQGGTQLPVQALGVGTEGAQGLPGALQELVVDELRMQLDPGVEALGQGEHQVVVGDLQGLGTLALTPVPRGPLLTGRTMTVPAAVVEAHLVAAALALQVSLAQGLGATGEQMMADLPLAWAERVRLAVVREALLHHSGKPPPLSHGAPPWRGAARR